MSEKSPALKMEKGMEFANLDALEAHRLAYCKEHNVDIVIRRSGYKKNGHITYMCKHGDRYRRANGPQSLTEDSSIDSNDNNSGDDNGLDGQSGRPKRATKTYRRGCEYQVNVYQRKANANNNKPEHWTITSVNKEHNRPIAGCLSTYSRNRQLGKEEEKHVVELLAARASNGVIIDNIKIKYDTNLNLLPKDLSNMRYRLSGNSDDPKTRSVFAFIEQLEAADYDVRWGVNDKNELTCLFFTHDNCIKQARRFREVVIMDATYKTNRSKLPLVNIVGVDNVCRGKTNSLMSFAIAGAWISAETTECYTWVLKQLESSVFSLNSHWRPKVFVTDQEHALMNGIDTVFPESATILCYIHLMRNFTLKLEKQFT